LFKEGKMIFQKLALQYAIGEPQDCKISEKGNAYSYHYNGYTYQIEVEGNVEACKKGWEWSADGKDLTVKIADEN